MSKKQLHIFWDKIRGIRPWYFLVIAVLSGLVAVSALRQNNLKMIELRAAVVQADKTNGDVETALRNLREFVYNHMNTNLASGNNAIKPPIQLKYRYDRLVAAEKKRVVTNNAQVYSTAQKVCEKKVPQGLSGRGRVPCIQQYVSTHGAKEQPIPDGLYKFDFVSPGWSPDLAGFGLLIAGLSAILFVASYGLERWVKAELR
jgi:hypothetical protein